MRGYHPLYAVIAGTADVVHSRLRGGNANSGRGAAGFVTETINRVHAAGASGPLTLRADSGFYSRKVVDACRKAGVRSSITVKLNKALHKAIAAIADEAWTPIPYFLDGADVAETTYRPFGKKAPLVRLIVRRVKPTPGSQLALFVDYSYHAFITDRDGDTLELEADHRRHAVVEDAVRDLKHGVGLNHLPSGRFGANAAWLTLNVIAHNLARWVSRLGLGETLIATDTLRRRHLRTPDGSPAPPANSPCTSPSAGRDRPVCTAATIVHAGVNLVEWVSTSPDARGRGFGVSITFAAATADRASPAVLLSSDDGRPVYERLGFVAVARWTLWTRPGR